MDYKMRQIPTRESLIRTHKKTHGSDTTCKTELTLTILAAADAARSRIYDKYQNEFGISLGNIALLMALNCNDGLGILELGTAIGVKPSTVSIMLKRMLHKKDPLIELHNHTADSRVKIVSLSAQGRYFIDEVLLPGLNRDIEQFMAKFSIEEAEQLLSQLKKLL